MKSLLIYWKHISQTGMVMPAPKHVISKMASGADLATARVVVEFGPGDGKITKQLLAEMPADSRYFAFEVNEELIGILRQHPDTRLEVIAAGAQLLRQELNQRGIEKVDYIFSSMPMSFLKDSEFETLAKDCADMLVPSGAFIQYQYSLKTYAVLKQFFTKIQLKVSVLCIPPAIVYICQKMATTADDK